MKLIIAMMLLFTQVSFSQIQTVNRSDSVNVGRQKWNANDVYLNSRIDTANGNHATKDSLRTIATKLDTLNNRPTILHTYQATILATVDSVDITVPSMTTSGFAYAIASDDNGYFPIKSVICRSGFVTVIDDDESNNRAINLFVIKK